MGGNNIMCFVNLIVKNLSLNLRKEKYTRSRKNLSASQWYQMFACQLHVMEMKIVRIEAGAFGPIFGLDHL